MELRHLTYFMRIAATSNFTRAATSLNVTQPTLSHQIKQLETEIGVPLFDRLGRSVRLTTQGRIFREHVERALGEIERGLAAITELDAAVRGSLTMGVFRSFGNSPLPGVLAQFNRSHPDVRIFVHQVSRADMERGLLDGRLDLAVTTHHHTVPARIEAEEIFSEPLVLVVGREHPLYGRDRTKLRTLASHPLVLREAAYPSRKLIDRCLLARKVKATVAMEVSSTEAILAIVRRSTLATICAARVVEGNGDLHAVALDEPRLHRTGAILWARGRHRSAAARSLRRMIRDAYDG